MLTFDDDFFDAVFRVLDFLEVDLRAVLLLDCCGDAALPTAELSGDTLMLTDE